MLSTLGIHDAKNEKKKGHGWGRAFTANIRQWMESNYSEWDSVMSGKPRT